MKVTVIRQVFKIPTLKSSLTPVVAVVFVALSTLSARGEEHYRVDPATSKVHFTLGASDGSVNGAFRVTSGEFTLDPQSGAMTETVSVDATSVRSGNVGRDKKMTSAQLKAQAYPAITFAPTRLSGPVKDSGDSAGQVEGIFALLGQSHPITVPMTRHIRWRSVHRIGQLHDSFCELGSERS